METKRVQFLLTSLIILVILILAVIFLIFAYPSLLSPQQALSSEITSTQIPSVTQSILPSATTTPTPSRTLRPTPSSTITPTPTETLVPTLTPTPTGPPALVRAQPNIGDPYKLTEWSPTKADSMVALMNYYPNTLSEEARGENNESYYDAFFYATIAQREAILRYPDAPQADNWRWGLAYNLAQIGDHGSSEKYAELIAEGLNTGEVDLDNLTRWFKTKESRATLYMIELEPVPGYLSSYLLDVRSRGSGYILLLETSGAYQLEVLVDLFDFVNNPETRSIISNFTSSDAQDIGIYYVHPVDTTIAERPLMYNLGQVPVQEIYFRPSVEPFDIGMEFKNYWGAAENETGGSDLFFETSVFPPCPATIRQTYHWGGTYFELDSTNYTFEPNQETLSYCGFLADHAANTWGYEPAIQLMEMLLPEWPPEEDENGKPYPPEARDEWLYKLGIYHAQLGNYDEAAGYLTQLTSNPTEPVNEWYSLAETFLADYHKPEDVYRACVNVQYCNANHALDYLINRYPRQNDKDTVEFLWQSGVALRASGYFDFDLDEQVERWFTVRHRPLEVLDLWILADSQSGERGLYLSAVDTSKPEFTYLDEDEIPPVVLVDSSYAIRLERDPDTFEPFLTRPILHEEHTDPFVEGMNVARDLLFAGEDPEIVIDMLLHLEKNPGLTCERNWTCDPYYYYLGLAYELAGHDRLAIETYLFLWWNYSKSPFTIMARLKLEATTTQTPPAPTAIVTPATSTPTPPAGTTPTATTSGPSPSPSPYPIYTPTETYDPYPGPTPTF